MYTLYPDPLTIQEKSVLRPQQTMIIDDQLWYVVDYEVNYVWNRTRYKAKLRSANDNFANPFTNYSTRTEFTIEFEVYSRAVCGECGREVFFAQAQGIAKRIIVRDGNCCIGREISAQYQQFKQAKDDMLDALEMIRANTKKII
jgi:hypothetical protein